MMDHKITIFKHEYDRSEAVSELKGFIINSDVIMLEAMGSSQKLQGIQIGEYNLVLGGKFSRAGFIKHNSHSDYWSNLWEILINYKKPIVYADSFNDEEGLIMDQRYNVAKRLLGMAYSSFHYGLAEQALEKINSHFNLVNELVEKRDKNIAKRIDNLDEIISNNYPLKVNNSLNVLIAIGYHHCPEKYVLNERKENMSIHTSKVRSPLSYLFNYSNTMDNDGFSKVLLSYAFNRSLINKMTFNNIANLINGYLTQFDEVMFNELCNKVTFSKENFEDCCYRFFNEKFGV